MLDNLYHSIRSMPFAKILLFLWIVFASIYVVVGEYNRINRYVAQVAYNQGMSNAVVQLIQQASTCQTVPVSAGNAKMTLVSVECLQGAAEAQPDAPAEEE